MHNMCRELLILCLGILLTLATSGFCQSHKNSYDLTLISINGNSTNNELCKLDLRAEVVRRGTYGISGTVEINFDLNDDEFIEVKSYRSARGGNEYERLKLGIKKNSFKSYMSTAYKTFVMKDYANCSDLPQSAGDEIPMFQANKIYRLDKCLIKTDKLPSYLTPGYYKVDIHGTGVVEFFIESIVRIESKL